MEMHSLAQELSGNAYPGRGIVIGTSEDGKYAVSAYFIMGRSSNSRNRVFVTDGEGIRKAWSHQDMADIFYDDAPMIGEIILETIRTVDADDRHCECLSLRKETLLKDVYNEVSSKG